jgi:competence protein ComEC
MFRFTKVFLSLNLVLLGFLSVKGFVAYTKLENNDQQGITAYYGKKIELSGLICSEAEVDFRWQRLVICVPERILIFTPLYPEYNYGDFLRIRGILEEPPVFADFDYRHYLASQNIHALLYYPQLELITGKLPFAKKVYLLILNFKWKLKNIINKGLPEPEASLANALLLGYKKALFPTDNDMFARAGLSHLIVVSGAHIMILSSLLFSFLIFLGLPRFFVFKVIFIFLFFYPIIVGLGFSAIRAAIMGALMFLALYYGRMSKTINALIFSANLILIFNPQLLWSDIGFQLSFAAVLGIIYLYPLGNRIKQKLKRIKGLLGRMIVFFWEMFSLTLACQLAVLPILVINFQSFSLISLLANPLVIWIFPFIIASLLIALIFSALFPIWAPFLFAPAYFMLTFLFNCVRFFASVPGATVSVANFSRKAIFVYYFLLIFSLWFIRQLNQRKRK